MEVEKINLRNQSDRGSKKFGHNFHTDFPDHFSKFAKNRPKLWVHDCQPSEPEWDLELKFDIRGLHPNRGKYFFGTLKLSLFWMSNRPTHFWHVTAFFDWIRGIFLLQQPNLNQIWDRFCIILIPLDSTTTTMEQISKTLPKNS